MMWGLKAKIVEQEEISIARLRYGKHANSIIYVVCAEAL
jgi:hypothetical protein